MTFSTTQINERILQTSIVEGGKQPDVGTRETPAVSFLCYIDLSGPELKHVASGLTES